MINSHLDDIVASEIFATSDRLRDFLRFIVQETLEGRAERIKAYTIALDVFSKDPAFDPLQDPIVRITAVRLRHALELYYGSKYAPHNVRIGLPKGKYIPTFEFPQKSMPIGNKPRVRSKKYRLMIYTACLAIGIVGAQRVLSFFNAYDLKIEKRHSVSRDVVIILDETQSDRPERANIAHSLTAELMRNIVSDGSVKAIQFSDLAQLSSKDSLLSSESAKFFLLKSEFHVLDNMIHVDWRLLDYPSKIVLWSGTTKQEYISSFAPNISANTIVSSIIGVDGAIPLISSRWYTGNAGDRSCFLASRRFIFEYNTGIRQSVKSCLENFVKEDGENIDVWSALSIVYLSFVRHEISLGSDPTHYRNLFINAIDRVRRLGGNTYMGQLALLYASTANKDRAAMHTIINRLLHQYKGDPGLNIRIGGILVFAGEYAEGVQLLNRTLEHFGLDSGLAFFPLALERYVAGDYRVAIDLANRADHQDYYLTALVQLVASAEIGDSATLDRAKTKLLALRPGYVKNYHDDLTERFFDDAIIKKIGRSFEKAGLFVPKSTH